MVRQNQISFPLLFSLPNWFSKFPDRMKSQLGRVSPTAVRPAGPAELQPPLLPPTCCRMQGKCQHCLLSTVQTAAFLDCRLGAGRTDEDRERVGKVATPTSVGSGGKRPSVSMDTLYNPASGIVRLCWCEQPLMTASIISVNKTYN